MATATTPEKLNGTALPKRNPNSRPQMLTPIREGIAPELLMVDQWVLWRMERRGKDGDWTKVPKSADWKQATSTDRSTWAPFEKAWERWLWAEHCRLASGVGFVFAANGGYCGIDLDDVRDPLTGIIRPEGQEIIDLFGSYTEISPSGTGAKIWIRGSLPPGSQHRKTFKADGGEITHEFEFYDRSRYFAVTGRRVDGTPAEIVEGQEKLDELLAKLFPRKSAARARINGHSFTPESSENLDVAGIIELASRAKNGDKFRRLLAGDCSDYGGDESRADFAFVCMVSFYTRNATLIFAVIQASGLMRGKWEREDYRDSTIGKALELVTETYKPKGSGRNGFIRKSANKSDSNQAGAADTRAQIEIDTDEIRVNDEVERALSADKSIFQRSGALVHLVPDDGKLRGITRPKGASRIVPIPAATLREKSTAVAYFFKITEGEDGPKEVAVHPPGWTINAVHARGRWNGIPYLEGVVSGQIMRPDGSILSEPGYDAATGLFLEPSTYETVAVPESPTLADAQEAAGKLLDVVCDFPFAQPMHRSAWLAYTLTPLARFVYSGPAPLFFIDANVRGSGKSLLADLASRICTGREAARLSYPGDDDEMRKRITALAIAGDSMVLIDNIAATFGGPSLDAALTSTVWKDRILGKSEIVELPLLSTWAASGNNVILAADTSRRVAHIRLESPDEHPEERTGFRHADVGRFVQENRPALLAAGLTILRAYHVAGRPDQKLTPWGSFEAWSAFVRSAVTWLGLEDPGKTRNQLRAQSDSEALALNGLITGLEKLDADKNGITVAEIVQKIRSSQRVPGAAVFKDALLDVCAYRGDFPNNKAIGRKLQHFRGRVVGGKALQSSTYQGILKWFVSDVSGGSGASRGSHSDPLAREF